ncbi:hypothetical protein DSO57_1022926 [Entomophthora muscae]|uniref:Uncharacterized protein n=1 Tax=Entomophthora muscae TaxID=34485 RepID=A0ACC2UC33_9FUNG|nr:hypothetical protein DSO57_1022926 [Entomophthora muscae]
MQILQEIVALNQCGLTWDQFTHQWKISQATAIQELIKFVVNNDIHHVLILPSVGHFEDKFLAFSFASQNELVSESGNMIVWFPDSAQLTCPTHAGGK